MRRECNGRHRLNALADAIAEPFESFAGLAVNWRLLMNGLIYLVGLVVVILAILSFFGLR